MWRRRNPRPASQSSQYCECRSGRGAKIPPPAGGRSIGGLRPPFFTSRTPTRSVGCGIARRMGKSRARHVAVRSIITSPPCAPSGARPSPCRGGQIDSRSRDAPAPEFLQKPLQKVSPQRGGGAPTGAPSIGRTERMRQRAHRSPLASRRSTAALARQLNATAQPRPRFTRARGRRVLPAPSFALKRGTSRTGRNAGRVDARTARERGYKPRPREPHSPHRSAVTGRRPSMGEIRKDVTETVTNVKRASLKRRRPHAAAIPSNGF